MPPKRQPPSTRAPPSAVNGVTDTGPPSRGANVAENLVAAIKAIASDNNFKEFESSLAEIPRLRDQIEAKGKDVVRLTDEIETLKTAHSKSQQESLEVYNESRDKLNGEKAALEKQVSSLKADLRERDNTITKLEKKDNETQKLTRKLEESLKQQDDDLKQVRSEREKLQKELNARDAKIKELERDLAQGQSLVAESRKELDVLKEKNDSLSQRFQTTNDRLKELEDLAVPLYDADLEVSIDKLEGVWTSAYRLVHSHFRGDLPDSTLQNYGSWKKLKEHEILQHRIPLPPTNTSAAKHMRIAAILAILARSIDKLIFQPTYLLEEDSGIRELLLREAISCSKRESFCRALLGKMLPDEQAEAAKERAKRVAAHVMLEVQDLLPPDDAEKFKSGLERVAQYASDVWQDIQRAKERFEYNFELVSYQDIDWQPLSLEEDANGEQAPTSDEGGKDLELLVVFPRLYIVEDDEPDPITPGIVLMRSQSLAAARELERGRTSNSTFGKPPSARSKPQRTRRLSTAMNGAGSGNAEGGNFLPQPSASSGG